MAEFEFPSVTAETAQIPREADFTRGWAPTKSIAWKMVYHKSVADAEWKKLNEGFQAMRSCVGGGSFIDPSFPPTRSSLGRDGGNMRENESMPHGVEWQRPLTIKATIPRVITDLAVRHHLEWQKRPWRIFRDGIDPSDVNQGGLGDCWFLASLCVLAERPELVKKLFLNGIDEVSTAPESALCRKRHVMEKPGLDEAKVVFCDICRSTCGVTTEVREKLKDGAGKTENEGGDDVAKEGATGDDAANHEENAEGATEKSWDKYYHCEKCDYDLCVPCATAEMTIGAYQVRMCCNGKWETIVVDDRFPTYDGRFAFVRSDAKQLWPMILEKAYAKVNGGYGALSGGRPGVALQDLTGYPCERFQLLRPNEWGLNISQGVLEKQTMARPKAQMDVVWEKLVKYRDEGYLMALSTIASIDLGILGLGADSDLYDAMGLASSHAYAILDVREVQRNGVAHRLVKCRNPWGIFEWRGAWGDNSPMWTEELRAELSAEVCQDGSFWMPFDDVCDFFSEVAVCRIHEDWFDKRFEDKFPAQPTMVDNEGDESGKDGKENDKKENGKTLGVEDAALLTASGKAKDQDIATVTRKGLAVRVAKHKPKEDSDDDDEDEEDELLFFAPSAYEVNLPPATRESSTMQIYCRVTQPKFVRTEESFASPKLCMFVLRRTVDGIKVIEEAALPEMWFGYDMFCELEIDLPMDDAPPLQTPATRHTPTVESDLGKESVFVVIGCRGELPAVSEYVFTWSSDQTVYIRQVRLVEGSPLLATVAECVKNAPLVEMAEKDFFIVRLPGFLTRFSNMVLTCGLASLLTHPLRTYSLARQRGVVPILRPGAWTQYLLGAAGLIELDQNGALSHPWVGLLPSVVFHTCAPSFIPQSLWMAYIPMASVETLSAFSKGSAPFFLAHAWSHSMFAALAHAVFASAGAADVRTSGEKIMGDTRAAIATELITAPLYPFLVLAVRLQTVVSSGDVMSLSDSVDIVLRATVGGEGWKGLWAGIFGYSACNIASVVTSSIIREGFHNGVRKYRALPREQRISIVQATKVVTLVGAGACGAWFLRRHYQAGL